MCLAFLVSHKNLLRGEEVIEQTKGLTVELSIFVYMKSAGKSMQKYLERFDFFSPEEIEEAVALGVYESIQKGAYFFEEDKVCDKVAFVQSGVFRHFYYDTSGEEITYCFTLANNFVTAYSSFVSNQTTPEKIQALTDSELFVLPKVEIERLIHTRKGWMAFSKIIADKQYIKRENRIFLLQKEKAKQKYEHLLLTKPEYFQNIPLQYLASYIGITQRHLSRLRREIAF